MAMPENSIIDMKQKNGIAFGFIRYHLGIMWRRAKFLSFMLQASAGFVDKEIEIYHYLWLDRSKPLNAKY
jgi:hypothetical protein